MTTLPNINNITDEELNSFYLTYIDGHPSILSLTRVINLVTNEASIAILCKDAKTGRLLIREYCYILPRNVIKWTSNESRLTVTTTMLQKLCANRMYNLDTKISPNVVNALSTEETRYYFNFIMKVKNALIDIQSIIDKNEDTNNVIDETSVKTSKSKEARLREYLNEQTEVYLDEILKEKDKQIARLKNLLQVAFKDRLLESMETTISLAETVSK
jgi:hypothetical protein